MQCAATDRPDVTLQRNPVGWRPAPVLSADEGLLRGRDRVMQDADRRTRGSVSLHSARTISCLIAIATVLFLASVDAESTGPTPLPTVPALAPAWQPLRFAAPVPGSYELPHLGKAADGAVLDDSGRVRRLAEFFGDRIAVLSFVYTSCPDVNACPMASYVLNGIQRRLSENPGLRNHVRLVSMSFDPEKDNPAAMRKYSAHLRHDGTDWQFLTTESEAALAPILEAYGQNVRKEYDESGRPLGTISHVLRVFLVDRESNIRNIYTTSFLHADTLWSDIVTLRDEEARREAARGHPETEPTAAAERSGVAAGRGVVTDLMRFVRATPLGLPAVPIPADNPLSEAKVALGRKLFYDRRLSHNDTMSCAMCHIPEQGFTSREMATAVGIEGQTVRRNAPTIYNVAYLERLFHDARESRLEQQVWSPLLARNEMGNPSIGYVLEKIRRLPDYAGWFEAVFDGRGPSMETVGMALASYERAVVSAGSPFDRWHFGGETAVLPAAAKRGFELFTGKARCASCHTIGATDALFTDQELHNTGVGYRQAMQVKGERTIEVAPATVLTYELAVIGSAAEKSPNDLGRYEITQNPDDRWKYRTPSLRNVALSPPYMHDGSISSLRAVVEYYDAGGVAHDLLDPRIQPLGLSPSEKDDLVAFLESLTGDNVEAIVEDALAAPVGDPG